VEKRRKKKVGAFPTCSKPFSKKNGGLTTMLENI
jgi:hypothetical protein